MNLPNSAQATSSGNNTPFNDILLGINFASTEEIKKMSTGQMLAERIYGYETMNADNVNFFRARAAKWTTLEQWAMGTQDMSQFMDYFNVSNELGNKAYFKMDMTPVMIGPQFVGTLVESMSKNEEYPCVSAVDDDSLSEKEQRYQDALYRMQDQENIQALQEAGGVQLEDPDAYVPQDKLSAEVYFKLEDRLPKEIDMEEKLQGVLSANEYERILKRKIYWDLIVKNIGVNKIEADPWDDLVIRKCVPQNMIYSFFLGETGKTELGYIGEVYKLKIRDARLRYGKSASRPNGLDEKKLYDLAKTSNQRPIGFGFNDGWRQEYDVYNYNRPWDDYSVLIFDFEIPIVESDYYVTKTDSFGKENIAPKKSKPEPKSDKAVISKKDKTRWYRGVYAPLGKMMLYWGLPDLVIFPFMNVDVSLSSYTVNIPNNNGNYVPSLFERIMEPLREYALTKLKRKQLISKLRPSGIRIDVESARNLNLGNGNTIAWEEVVRVFDQTGNELWSSKGVNPLEPAMPALSNTPNDDAVQKIIQLTSVLESCVAEMRTLIGVPQYRDGADVGDRTAAKLAEMQNTSSFNVTDFISNAENQLMEETLYKILLVQWQRAIKKGGTQAEDLINSRFKVEVQMKQTAYEKELLENNIQTCLKTIDGNGKPLISFKDAMKIRQIRNFKLAELFLANAIETNERVAREQSALLQKQNQEVQSQSAQMAAQQAQQLQKEKLSSEKEMEDFKAVKTKEIELLKGVLAAAAKDESGQLISMFLPAIQQLVPNISLPLATENKQMEQAIQQQEIAEQQQKMIEEEAQRQGISPEEVMEQMKSQQQQEGEQSQESQQQVA